MTIAIAPLGAPIPAAGAKNATNCFVTYLYSKLLFNIKTFFADKKLHGDFSRFQSPKNNFAQTTFFRSQI
ncbi:MAG: hypothetical protein QNJ38_21365 [Prochloraceae cyanobacterium]|nr:hypothetical protein [Prochloraceae cyanobacterium]